MKLIFAVEDAIRKRYSVRSYDNRPIDQELKNRIISYAENSNNPLGPKVRVQFVEKELAPNGEKLGTYGIIKGAKTYLGVTVPDEEHAMEALGYEFEQLVLYLTSLGLGTCWLGGTFNRGAFEATMEIKENELFPILSPIGFPAKKKSLIEQIMRKSTNADGRLEWQKLFFKDQFANPLSSEMAGDYKHALEMLRLAPSAVNKQPWRVVVTESGHFERKSPNMEIPEDMTYIVSWISD